MSENGIIDAVKAVNNHKLVVYPTDTLYGLGSTIKSKKAIQNIFTIKHRPVSIPLPVAVSDMHMLADCVELTPLANKLAETFFPGKLTLICKKKNIISDLITANKLTVAIRIPDDEIALQLISNTGPLITTSANIHGQPTPSRVSEIRKLFKPEFVEVYIDDGPRKGKPSTIVDVTGSEPVILREGRIPADAILNMSESI